MKWGHIESLVSVRIYKSVIVTVHCKLAGRCISVGAIGLSLTLFNDLYEDSGIVGLTQSCDTSLDNRI